MFYFVIRYDNAHAEHECDQREDNERNLPLKRKRRQTTGVDLFAHRHRLVLLIPTSPIIVLLGAQLTISVLERSPQVPAGDGAVRAPLRADLPNVFWCWTLPLTIGALDGVLNAKVQFW